MRFIGRGFKSVTTRPSESISVTEEIPSLLTHLSCKFECIQCSTKVYGKGIEMGKVYQPRVVVEKDLEVASELYNGSAGIDRESLVLLPRSWQDPVKTLGSRASLGF